MTNIWSVTRILAGAATLLLLVVSSSHGVRTVEAQSPDGLIFGRLPGHGLVGTWFISAQSVFGDGSGFYTYEPGGRLIGFFSTMHGGPPHPVPGTLGSTDQGIWRRVRGGFEAIIFRMDYDPATGNVTGIARFRNLYRFDGGRDRMVGEYLVAVWNCPSPSTCPDPNLVPPDLPEFAPPVNSFTQTRVRFP